ncbi:MAG: VWA domain-containing protein [Myxococcota bacterium]|nr:VWA domain-containing protein [Myxococcota bacterium]
MNSTSLHFASPELASLLWVWLGFAVLLVLLERRGSGALDRLVAGALQSRLVERPANWRRWLRVALLLLASLFMVLALMRPQWGLRFVATPRVGAEIMIALDVSRSMLADDTKPSRLERAKAEVTDLLSYLGQDHVGLIAFAGRASVLSPMTPDRSFLRLVLDNVGPHSVSRGGTNLAEPILRAVSGLGEPGPAQRALILITDGEDHDSFALDAAKQAAEAGIKIIAIGFGDEAGSQIYLTDPRTRARTLLRDGSGDPVLSRLDGELLREIALATDGAYIPAGTGVLDLTSIYQEHIEGLTRSQLDSRGRSIRDEMYAWFVLLAIVCLVAAVAIAAGRGEAGARPGTRLAALALAIGLSLAPAVEAQPGPDEPDALATSEAPVDDDALAPESPGPVGVEETPREQFNRATAALANREPASAEPLLLESRQRATDDTELRYATAYNLGIAAVERAEAIEPAQPQEALEALYEAADWFRTASAQHPDDPDSRHNLDVALRKALILADFLAKQSERGLAEELDALLGAQRARVADAAGLLEQVVHGGELDGAERLRPAFAASATEQRTLLAEAAEFGERAALERDSIAAMNEQERSPQDAMRGAQLDAVLHYLDAALERMGQARSQLRKRSAERAYRRSSAALAELARARDQLRDPVEQIGVLMAEIGGLVRSSAALATEGKMLPGSSEPVRIPAFLTPESAQRDNDRVQERVAALAAGFEAGLEAAAQQADDPAAGAQPSSPEQQAMLAAVAEATPHVSAAAHGLGDASRVLGEQRYRETLEAQRLAGAALAEARERFFDLRQLLEAAYTDERQIAEIAGSSETEIARFHDEYAPALRELQNKNLGRGERLDDLLKKQAQEMEDAAAAAAVEAEGDPNAAEQIAAASKAQRERLGVASQLLTHALAAMDDAIEALGEDGATPQWPEAATAARQSADQLEILRTLFFSIVEHVRELARLQLELADRTQDAAALAAAEHGSASRAADAPGDDESQLPVPVPVRGPETRERAAELAPEQLALAERSGAIGDALAMQAEQAATAPPEQAGPEAEEDARRLRAAGEHVVSAQLAMRGAGEVLANDATLLPPALEHQATALEELEKALELLVPPGQRQPEQDPQQQQQQQPEQEAGDEEAEARDNPGAEADPSQLLQSVRDREAERRRERERSSSRYEPVEKDW